MVRKFSTERFKIDVEGYFHRRFRQSDGIPASFFGLCILSATHFHLVKFRLEPH